jgi:DNA polymerase elongation subunit (family B)
MQELNKENMTEKATPEEIEAFLLGNDPEKYIVALEYGWRSSKIYKIKEDPKKGKIIETDTFIPFCWVGDLSKKNFYNGSKQAQKEAISKHGILIEKLHSGDDERLNNGLTYLIKTIKTYRDLVSFFRQGGINPWDSDNRDAIMILPPIEQYLVQKEKRLFKGFEEYDNIHRFVFDLETTALNPEDGRIFMIGMKDNRGFEKVIEIGESETEEVEAIYEFFETINNLRPTIIGGYNSSNFDWNWLFKRAEILQMDTTQFKTLNPNEGYKINDGVLKLGAEIEDYKQIKIWGYNSLDIAHAVRRAQTINSEIKSWGLKYITQFSKSEKPNRVYVPGDKIASTYRENKEFYLNVENGKYKPVGGEGLFDIDKKFPKVYKKVGGAEIVEQYLMDDLWETMEVDGQFNQASFLLASMVPTSYERVSTMGTATLWKMLMLAWSYHKGLAVPSKDSKRPFVGGLSRLVKTGYSTNVLKLDFSSLYPSIQLVHNVFPECDITDAMKGMLKYFRDTRIMYKNLASEYYSKDKKKSESYGRKQLPIKIFINSMFGSLSAPQVFPWGDMNMGEKVTCTARQYLRQMVRFFMDKGYDPLVMDTDGVNFSCPLDVEDRSYVGLGNNELVKKGKEYKGSEADVAEYNDLFMRGEMGLDTDGQWPSCINVARKNYALLMSSGKVKLTGNSIKSKKIQGYLEEFIDKGLRMLLEGRGGDFVEYYYEYLQKIYDRDILLAKIANKSRVKQTIESYKKRCTQRTKAGNLMARQAHMELVIANNLQVSLGDTIYYVNNGKAMSHGDVQRKKKKDGTEEIVLNSYLISENDLENGMKGEYNVPRYINTFNKRVEPLLVCFKKEVRDSLLKKKPEDREYYTKTQCTLINGVPRKEGDQDSLEEILTLSPEEKDYWIKMNLSENYFMEELGIFESV